MLASVVITNHDYERFVEQAIASALAQTHAATEVVVVDDGSTDGSRDLLERRRGDVELVLKPNGGQRSAFNAGFARSRGELVVFLDADDVLDPTAVERAVELLDPSVSKVHWPLRGIDAGGSATGDLYPAVPLPAGSLRDLAVSDGPYCCAAPPASGNAWSRRFLERVMPMAEVAVVHRNHAEAQLVGPALLFGELRAIPEPLGSYRLHGANDYATVGYAEQLERDLALYEERCDALARHCDELGLAHDRAAWQPRRTWLERLTRSLRELERIVPAREPFLFVDECQWALPRTPELVPLPFPRRDGDYWGPPAADADAIAALDAERRRGIRFVAFAWQAFWWLDHYAGFAAHLRGGYTRRLANDRLVVFEARCGQPERD